MIDDKCIKCGESDWGIGTSSSSGKIKRYCRCCRIKSAAKYTERKKSNGVNILLQNGNISYQK